jgi:hypothetical protein
VRNICVLSPPSSYIHTWEKVGYLIYITHNSFLEYCFHLNLLMSVINGNKTGLKLRDWQASSGTRAHESENQSRVARIYNFNESV